MTLSTTDLKALLWEVEKNKNPGAVPQINDRIARLFDLPIHSLFDFIGSVDGALTLLPPTAINMHFIQYGRGWATSFHDTAQKLGPVGAGKYIERMGIALGGADRLHGEVRLKLEKGIAEHWLEFKCQHAETLAQAIVSMAIRCKMGIAINSEFDEKDD